MIAETILRTVTAAGENAWTATAVKATMAMLTAMLIVRLTQRASAALRHVVIAATLGALLLLPIAAMLVPSRTVTLPAPAKTIAHQRVAGAPQATATVPSSKPAGIAPSLRSRISLLSIGYGTYAAGVALLIASLLIGMWRVHRVHGRANVSVSGTRLANELARRTGMRDGIEVAIADELAVPVTFGSLHPVILLPGATRDWSEEDLGRAIRHEMEHITRGDWAAHIVSRLACAMYWPHPFVWVLLRRLRLEAERACDDAVIRSGGTPESYAEQLVALARRLVGRETPALAMATRTNLGQRVEAILDHTRRRAPLTRFASFAVAVITVACTIAVAPFKLMSAPIDKVSGHQSARHQSADEADPLDMALLMAAERDDRSTMQRLLERGAAADAAIDGDGSPLIAAARKGHVEAMQMLITAGADVNRGVQGDGSPLIEAARGGYLEAVRLLLNRGARIDDGVEGDGNALIAAAGAGKVEVVAFLLDSGANIEKVVRGDENALIHASETGQLAAVRLLIAHGANVNVRVWVDRGDGESSRGEWRSPLIMAARNHHENVLSILRAAGAKE
jgi:beta-lactamase regulating signal transducer with metallopeptidase domain